MWLTHTDNTRRHWYTLIKPWNSTYVWKGKKGCFPFLCISTKRSCHISLLMLFVIVSPCNSYNSIYNSYDSKPVTVHSNTYWTRSNENRAVRRGTVPVPCYLYNVISVQWPISDIWMLCIPGRGPHAWAEGIVGFWLPLRVWHSGAPLTNLYHTHMTYNQCFSFLFPRSHNPNPLAKLISEAKTKPKKNVPRVFDLSI